MTTEDERLKAAADDIYRQLADNPGIGIPVDPDMVDFLGLTEAPPELADGATGASFWRSMRTGIITIRIAGIFSAFRRRRAVRGHNSRGENNEEKDCLGKRSPAAVSRFLSPAVSCRRRHVL